MRSRNANLAMLLMASLTVASCNEGSEKSAPAEITAVGVQEIMAQPSSQSLRYSGTIEPDNTAQIGFAVPGVVSEIFVQEGQQVRQGQLLASIDATEYINALKIAEAGLEQAEDMYTRLDGLYKKGSLPEKDYIDIRTKLAQAKANKSINGKRIADSKLYAPISGIITNKAIERGSTAAPGIPAFTLIKTDRLYVKVSVPESEVGTLSKGMAASVWIPTLNDSVKGYISIINPQADAVSKTYAVKILINNATERLLPGMIADVSIVTGRSSDVLSVPANAIVRDADGLTYAFLASQKHKAVRRRVVTGNLVGNNEVVIISGLNAGDKIVTAGQTHLKDGAAISF